MPWKAAVAGCDQLRRRGAVLDLGGRAVASAGRAIRAVRVVGAAAAATRYLLSTGWPVATHFLMPLASL
jgi:hypothetical protein